MCSTDGVVGQYKQDLDETTHLLVCVGFAALAGNPRDRAATEFQIDPQSSEESGAVDFDPAVSKISGIVVVAAGSGNSGNETRDERMSKDILDVPHFAEISFVPRGYQGAIALSGDSTIQVTGGFILHGMPHDLTVPAHIQIDGANCTMQTHFAVL